MATPSKPSIGEPAPPIEALSASGEKWTLAEHLGATVVLIFHRHIH